MKKQTKVFLLLLLALCLLTACGKKEEALEVYTLGESAEDDVVALDTILDEGEAMLHSIDAPTDAAIAAKLDISHTYHYRQMADPAELAARYIAVLRGDEQGFKVIDIENRRVEAEPDTDVLAGTVLLGKAAAATTEEGGSRILRVIVGWSEYAVAVQVAYIDGKILPPLKEDKDSEDGNGAQGATGLSDQLSYFNSLAPGKLGLDGDSMSEYMTFPQQGWVMVDDIRCRKINVYRQDAQTAINEFVGTFYLSSDLSKLYKVTGDGQVTLMQMD